MGSGVETWAVTFTLGIYELFTYAIPGGLQLSVFLYVASRLDMAGVSDLANLPELLLAFAIIVGSYLVGYAIYPLGMLVDKIYKVSSIRTDAWRAVASDAAKVGRRRLPDLHPWLLFAAVELRDRESAQEIGRFRAAGLMLRNAVVPITMGVFLALAETVAGPNRWISGSVALLLAATVIGLARQGKLLRFWAWTKTFQVAYWLDLPEDAIAAEASIEAAESAKSQRTP